MSDYIYTDAAISKCGQYRHWLVRQWSETGKICNFIMLNPSTADANEDDPTIKRCVSFAKSFGCGTLIVTNLFDYRATSPKDMIACENPSTTMNDMCIGWFSVKSLVICAWGLHGQYMGRDKTVIKSLKDHGIKPKCLKLTKDGIPGHPLYLPSSSKLLELD